MVSHCEQEKPCSLKWSLAITSETCSDEAQASALGNKRAVEVLLQYFINDPTLFPNTIISSACNNAALIYV